MSEYRTIAAIDCAGFVPPTSFGRPVKLDWLAIKQLVVDPTYQREIVGKGLKNVRRIASNFNWSMFTPLIVAGVGGSRFAIVDGQHRTTAAAMCGIERVPCCIIEASRAEQAAAFSAVNGNITRLTSIQIHHASAAAGDKDAKRIESVCKRADVTVLRYPKPQGAIAAGETMAVAAIRRAVSQFGADCVTTALRAIRDSGDGNAGLLRGPIILSLSQVLHDHKDWREAGGRLIEAMDTVDLQAAFDKARIAAAQTRGTTTRDQLEANLIEALAEFFKRRRS